MFLLPFTFTALLIHYKGAYVQASNQIFSMVFVVNVNELLLLGFIAIWLLMTMIVSGVFLQETYRKYRLCRDNFDDGDSLALEEFERIKKALGVKGKVTLLRNCNTDNKSPFAVGLFHRKVVIPYLEYTKEELDIILYHELSHVKKSDILFRYLTTAAIIINSINPISYVLLKLVTHWSEADCDVRAIEGLEKEGIPQKRYADTIFRLMNETNKKREMFTMTMLSGAGKSLYGRLEFMNIYKNNVRKVAKPVTFLLVLVFALTSSVTAYGAGVGLAKVNDEVLKATQDFSASDPLEGFSTTDDWSDIMYISPEEDHVPNTVYINDGIMTLGEGSISWDVPVGTRYVTSAIYLTKGTIVQIACTATPSDCTYWFGLMYPSSTLAVSEGCGSGSRDFTVPSSGLYRILVENRSSQVIHVGGYYQY